MLLTIFQIHSKVSHAGKKTHRGRLELEMGRMGTSSGWLQSTEGYVLDGIVVVSCCVGGGDWPVVLVLVLVVGCCSRWTSLSGDMV